MFNNLFDMSYKRTGLQALGFYIVYLIMLVFAGGLLTAVIGTILHPGLNTFNEGYKVGLALGRYIAPSFIALCVAVISITILIKRNIYTNILAIFLFFISVGICFLFGAIIGLIPLSILTMFDNKRIIDNTKEL